MVCNVGAGGRPTERRFIADQQEKHSDSYQQGKRVPTTNDKARCRRSMGFEPAPFALAPMPNQKRRFAHSTFLSAAPEAVISPR